jgi:hypothetical protein
MGTPRPGPVRPLRYAPHRGYSPICRSRGIPRVLPFVHSLDCFHRECLVLASDELASLGRNVPLVRTRPIPWTEWVGLQAVYRPSIFLAPRLKKWAEYGRVRSWRMEIQ